MKKHENINYVKSLENFKRGRFALAICRKAGSNDNRKLMGSEEWQAGGEGVENQVTDR